MRVLVDAGNSGSGGYLHYLSGIFGSNVLEDMKVLLVCSPSLAAKIGPLDPQVTLRIEPDLDSPLRWKRLVWWRRCWPDLVKQYDPDVVLHPTGLLRGRSGDVPKVAIHHYMAPFMSASYRLYGVSKMSAMLALWRVRLLRSFRRADGVVFLAEYTRSVVSKRLGSRAVTAVVPNAVPPRYLQAGGQARAGLSSPVKLLCVSTLYLFKHQPNVVAAVAELRQELGLDIRLDLVGGGEPRAKAKLMRSIQDNNAGDWATVREVAASEMPAVYREADVFVFPSADEAWPVTLGEAMGSGLPIACSERMAMPDILRDAGTYFDPEDTPQVVEALRRLLTEPRLREEYGALAKEYAADYTWDRSARMLMQFLRTVSGGTR